jgi:hypothetical protein
MLEIRNAVGNEDSRFSGKETLGTDDVVLKHSDVRRCYGLGSGEGWHTKNVAGHMRINRGQDIIEKDPMSARQQARTTFTIRRLTNRLWHTLRAPVRHEHVVHRSTGITDKKCGIINEKRNLQ